MKVLVLGAGGFIGGGIAARLAADGHDVIGGARTPESARRRLPGWRWVAADFAQLQTAGAWLPLLRGVDAVVNCVGALQDGHGESLSVAHESGPAALFEACEIAGIKRVIHISAVGADAAAGTAYALSKLRTEEMLAASHLDWIALRPSLVVAREVYGGTALMRGLAGFPFLIPVVGGDAHFRPVALGDLAVVVSKLLEPGALSARVVEVVGPDLLSLRELLTAWRGWLGLPPAPTVDIPSWMAWPMVKLGDLAAWLGWPSSLRTTSLRQMNYGAAGDPAGVESLGNLSVGRFADHLAAEPAGVQDRWHARLYFVRPLGVVVLAAYWITVGALGFGPARGGAIALLEEAGFGASASMVSDVFHGFDLALGLALVVRRWAQPVAVLMALVCIGYLVTATALLPRLWVDPTAPWLKILPVIMLTLFVAATDDRR
ncbi:MAG: SDR family oxidoreductase [Sphingomonadaceae bacterium]|nr:SDR family oxidoreductase [Sphingomonadaceae bacterium]